MSASRTIDFFDVKSHSVSMSEKKEKYPSDLAERFQLRLPPGLRDRIKTYAERHGRSMNAEIVRLLEREFPEPWTVESRFSELFKMLQVIRKGASDDRLLELTNEFEETFDGIISGQVSGLSDKTMSAILWGWEEYCEERMKEDKSELDLDAEEAEQLGRSNTTAKFVDTEEPSRLERVKRTFPDMNEKQMEMVSSALRGGSVNEVLEAIGDVVRQQKLEQILSTDQAKLDEDIPF